MTRNEFARILDGLISSRIPSFVRESVVIQYDRRAVHNRIRMRLPQFLHDTTTGERETGILCDGCHTFLKDILIGDLPGCTVVCVDARSEEFYIAVTVRY